MAGLSAACCAVPARRPTAAVSIVERIGEQSQMPIAGRVYRRILPTVGAATSGEEDADVAVSAGEEASSLPLPVTMLVY